MYKEIAFEESVCDSDSELVKITRTKPKSKSGAWLRRKSKDKPSKEPTAEKGNEDLTAPVAPGPALLSGDNVVEEVDTDVGESDKEEGTSSIPQVRVQESVPRENFSSSPEKA